MMIRHSVILTRQALRLHRSVLRRYSSNAVFTPQQKAVRNSLLSLLDADAVNPQDLPFKVREPETQPGDMITLAKRVETDETTLSLIKFLLEEKPAVDIVSDRAYYQNLSSNPVEFFVGKQYTTSNYVLLLTIMASKGEIREGEALMEDMRARGVERSAATYNALIMLYGSNPSSSLQTNRIYLQRAQAAMNEMVHQGLVPSPINHASLLVVTSQLGFVDEADKQLEALWIDDVPVNEVAYLVVIQGLCKRGTTPDIDRCWELYHHLDGTDKEPSLYNQMLRVCGQFDEAEKAIGIYNEMSEAQVQPSLYTYANLIYALGGRHDFYPKCFEYYSELVSKGYVPNEYIFSNLLNACAKHGDLANAIKVFEDAEVHHVKRNQHMYATLLKTFGKVAIYSEYNVDGEMLSREKRIVMAHEYLYDMELQGHEPNIVILNTLLSVYTRSNLVTRAENCFANLFKKYNVKPGVASYMALMNMYSSMVSVNDCFGVIQRMREAKVEPTELIYNRLLHTCKKGQDWKRGVEVVFEMQRVGMTPLPQLTEYFIDAPPRGGRPAGNPHRRHRHVTLREDVKDKVQQRARAILSREENWKRSIQRKNHPQVFPIPRHDVLPQTPDHANRQIESSSDVTEGN